MHWTYVNENFASQKNCDFYDDHYYHHNDTLSADHHSYEEVKAYHDPWEDYYQELEAQQNELNNSQTPPATHKLTADEDNSCQYELNLPEEELDYSLIEITSTQHNNIESSAYSADEDVQPEVVVVNERPAIETNTSTAANCMECLQPTTDYSVKDSSEREYEIVIETQNLTNIPLEREESGLAGALANLRLGEQRTPEQEQYEQLMRRQAWEQGQIDYTGKDSFDNIWKRITQTLENKPTTASPDADPAATGSS